jgi:hypothetical protein
MSKAVDPLGLNTARASNTKNHTHGGAAFESVDGKNLYFFLITRRPFTGCPWAAAGRRSRWFLNCPSGNALRSGRPGCISSPITRPLQLLDEKTGSIRTVAKLQGHSVYFGMSISPDSEHLVFSEETVLHVDVMLVEGFR